MDPSVWRPPKGFKYHIPYRIFLSQNAENLLVAGRCVSCSHIAIGSIRVMAQCIGMGEAAGAAAAMSIKRNIPPRLIDVKELTGILRDRRCILSESDFVTL